MNNKSNKLGNEIAQLKINKSQKLESSSNVSVENTNEIKKMKDSIIDVNEKPWGSTLRSLIIREDDIGMGNQIF